jgi:ABC-type multidrug transport system ATPase subunit
LKINYCAETPNSDTIQIFFFRTFGISGALNVNNKESCYITQDDIHQPFLTVEEMMQTACQLKPNPSRNATSEQIINEILKNLNLDHRRNVVAKRLSGGERKRLSIAIELVANPSIFFLDEPTSGLDEVTALQCVRTLRGLAQQDRTVVCTIHQPSAAIFNLIDSLYVISQGLCVYQGAPQALVPFLTSLNLRCPTHYNPADYIIELCDSDPTLITTLSSALNNGNLAYHYVANTKTNQPEIMVEPITTTNTLLEEVTPKVASSINSKMIALSRFFKSQNPVSRFEQFRILVSLMFLKICRNRVVLWIQLIHHLICGIFIGIT